MNLITEEDGLIQYFAGLDQCEPEYKAYKCWSLIQFYHLPGRKSAISIDSLEPIPDVHYLCKGVEEEMGEEKYFFKPYRNYPLKNLFFTEKGSIFDGELAENIFVGRVKMGLIWVLYSTEQTEMLRQMCQRIWRANRTDEGTLSYKEWVTLADVTLRRDRYKEFRHGDIDYRTQLRLYDERIKGVFDRK